ncbi:11950_t:CDS:2 [Ambispora leptoticha]|uniref:11950_t:CDS:1 n=1 Tax=Ambispora leptoticha TaxID=144679 RepID=A0A9N9FG06_9GLOM|nr:11950_t:CDS:2 [Ambispora leptoticha]
MKEVLSQGHNIFFNTIALPLSKKAITGQASGPGLYYGFDINDKALTVIEVDGIGGDVETTDPAKNIIEK